MSTHKLFQSEVTSEPEVVHEAQPKLVLLPEHLDLKVELSEVVTLLEEDRPVHPQTFVTVGTSSLPHQKIPYIRNTIQV